MEEKSISARLDDLEKKLADVKLAYEKYFAGLERREPIDERDKLKRMVRDLVGKYVTNTQQKFRRSTLVNRFNSYSNLWDRITTQIDMGTYQPDRFKAHLRVPGSSANRRPPETDKAGKAAQSPPVKEEPERKVYREFLDARKKTGESLEVTYDKFKNLLDKQAPLLKERFKGKQVGYRIVIEDGKAKLKGFSKT